VMREDSWGVQFVDGLEPEPGTDTVVSHNRVNAFYDTPLAQILADLDCTHLVLFGVATHSVVEHTARHAADMGLVVTLVDDACSAFPRTRHDASLAAVDNLVTRLPAARLAFQHDDT